MENAQSKPEFNEEDQTTLHAIERSLEGLDDNTRIVALEEYIDGQREEYETALAQWVSDRMTLEEGDEGYDAEKAQLLSEAVVEVGRLPLLFNELLKRKVALYAAMDREAILNRAAADKKWTEEKARGEDDERRRKIEARIEELEGFDDPDSFAEELEGLRKELGELNK